MNIEEIIHQLEEITMNQIKYGESLDGEKLLRSLYLIAEARGCPQLKIVEMLNIYLKNKWNG